MVSKVDGYSIIAPNLTALLKAFILFMFFSCFNNKTLSQPMNETQIGAFMFMFLTIKKIQCIIITKTMW